MTAGPILTIGHGARSIGSFVAILREAAVAVLVDIRHYPGSRHHPQFGRRVLAVALNDAGIGYEWHGETLGGRRSRMAVTRHGALSEPALGGYADHMDTPEFRAAVDALAARAAVALMCAETQWTRCHRRLLADALELRGASVLHLLEVGRRERHRLHATLRDGEDGWPVYDVPDMLPGFDQPSVGWDQPSAGL